MPPKTLKTRQEVKERFGGTPNPLPVADLPTYRDICRQFYQIELNRTEKVTHEARLNSVDPLPNNFRVYHRRILIHFVLMNNN